MSDHQSNKQETLKALIVEAALQGLRDQLKQHPEQAFESVALSTIDDSQYINLSLNSPSNTAHILETVACFSEQDRSYVRWAPNEWGEFEYVAPAFWQAVDAQLAELYNHMHEAHFADFRSLVFAAMIEACADIAALIKQEMGLNLFVFATVYDSENAGEVGLKSGQAANPNHPLLPAFMAAMKLT